MELNTLDCVELLTVDQGIFLQVMPAVDGKYTVIGLVDVNDSAHFTFKGGEFLPVWPSMEGDEIVSHHRHEWTVEYNTTGEHPIFKASGRYHAVEITINGQPEYMKWMSAITQLMPPENYGTLQHEYKPYFAQTTLPPSQPAQFDFKRYSGIVETATGDLIAIVDRTKLMGYKFEPFCGVYIPAIDGDASLTVMKHAARVNISTVTTEEDIVAIQLSTLTSQCRRADYSSVHE